MSKAAAGLLLAVTLFTCSEPGGGIEIDNARLFLASPAARAGAVYMDIRNAGSTADRLIGVSTDAAQRAELHNSQVAGDMVQMQMAADGFHLGRGETLTLAPGGMHIMLMGLRIQPDADAFDLVLLFQQAGEVTLSVPATPAKAPR